MATNPLPRLTEEQYLGLERSAETKSEFLNGETFAMSGGTPAHNRIAVDLVIAVGTRLKTGPCEVFSSDQRMKVEATGLITYPDLMIACQAIFDGIQVKDTLTNPTLIAEVLSPSTESYDRGDKFRQYQTVPTIKTYLLVSCDRMRIEKYTRADGNTWIYQAYEGADAVLEIEEPRVSIPLQSIYSDVEFTQP